MTQVSKIPLPPKTQQELFDQFYRVLSQCQSSEEVGSFLNELLTRTERVVIAKRLFIAVLLTKGYSYRNIRTYLSVSFPTIRMVAFWLEHGQSGYKKAVERILAQNEFKNTLNSVDKAVDDKTKLLNNL